MELHLSYEPCSMQRRLAGTVRLVGPLAQIAQRMWLRSVSELDKSCYGCFLINKDKDKVWGITYHVPTYLPTLCV